MVKSKNKNSDIKIVLRGEEWPPLLDQLKLLPKPSKALVEAAKKYKKIEECNKRKYIVNKILTYTWDPLHTTPIRLYDKAELTEYDVYIDFIIESIDSGATIEELAELLACIVEQYMEDYVLPDREFRAAELLHEVR